MDRNILDYLYVLLYYPCTVVSIRLATLTLEFDMTDTVSDIEPYSRSAAVYDPLYESMKDYNAEASRVLEIAEEATGLRSSQMFLLDVACGTGLHLQHLAVWFGDVIGIDLSPDQLTIARQRLPNVKLFQRNMVDFPLTKPDFLGSNPAFVDIITCLFSSIGYMRTIEELQQAISNMAVTLNPGGALIVEPWLSPENYTVGSLHGDNVTNLPNLRISRMNIAEIVEEPGLPPRSRMEMHYMVGRPSGIERFTEVHELTLFSTKQYLEAITAAGLVARFDPDGLSANGRGVHIGIKPT